MPGWQHSRLIGTTCRNNGRKLLVGKKVVAYGELLWDILPDNDILGGAPFNFIYPAWRRELPSAYIKRINAAHLSIVQFLQLITTLLPTSPSVPENASVEEVREFTKQRDARIAKPIVIINNSGTKAG